MHKGSNIFLNFKRNAGILNTFPLISVKILNTSHLVSVKILNTLFFIFVEILMLRFLSVDCCLS